MNEKGRIKNAETAGVGSPDRRVRAMSLRVADPRSEAWQPGRVGKSENCETNPTWKYINRLILPM
jgi:hypothetical protein